MNARTPTGKSTEFARLFDFFARLASGNRDLFVPKEFESLVEVIPVSPTSSMASLPALCGSPSSVAMSISLPETEYDEHETTQNNLIPAPVEEKKMASTMERMPVPRGRRTSIAVVRGRGVVNRLARKFPLANGGLHEQFTFKLMIHELYDMNDFARMVQEVLASSQKQFRPLPESLTKRRSSVSGVFSWKEDLEEREEDRSVKESGGGLGGRFPKSLGLGRPSGLDVPAAERALKKRRVARRRSVSGGPMEKEPDWIVADVSIDETIDEIPRISLPSPRLAARSRKASASRNRAPSVALKRSPMIPAAVKEAAVVKHAETFLNVPRLRRAGVRPLERARSEEPEPPMSAPCGRESFGVLSLREEGAGDAVSKTIGAKRRLSFST